MTEALCLNCGAMKRGAIFPCQECGVASCGDTDLDITFSGHHVPVDMLTRFAPVIRAIRAVCTNDKILPWSFLYYVSENHPDILEVDVPSAIKGSVDRVLRDAGISMQERKVVTREDLICLSWDAQDALNKYVAVQKELFAPSWRSLVPIPGIYKDNNYGSLYADLENILCRLTTADDTAGHLMRRQAGECYVEYLDAFLIFTNALRDAVSRLQTIAGALHAKNEGLHEGYDYKTYRKELDDFQKNENRRIACGKHLNELTARLGLLSPRLKRPG